MKKSALSIAFILALSHVWAQSALRGRHFNLEDGVALQGYDPVAYFVQGKAIQGASTITHEREGVRYYFSSEANKLLFAKDSKKYEPQYGGWCAYAMGASAEKVEVHPETFKIIDGKLFLFYNSLFNNTLTRWNKAETTLKIEADKNWKAIYN